MNDLFLRFDTRDAAIAALEPLGMAYADSEGGVHLVQASHGFALWEVGEIPGREGWHINIRVVDPAFDISALEPFRVYPAAPVCVWA